MAWQHCPGSWNSQTGTATGATGAREGMETPCSFSAHMRFGNALASDNRSRSFIRGIFMCVCVRA